MHFFSRLLRGKKKNRMSKNSVEKCAIFIGKAISGSKTKCKNKHCFVQLKRWQKKNVPNIRIELPTNEFVTSTKKEQKNSNLDVTIENIRTKHITIYLEKCRVVWIFPLLSIFEMAKRCNWAFLFDGFNGAKLKSHI